ncbi:hypothetical protein KZX46_03610 (plasmid) [Polymorphobacter sp. PAMC 29334]|uniref:hypothetical protein n=1 Tax=Polymorphobacter sp. PAMC 29334 TaxID=2862331 RepID=UPI001C77056E|nr:hypothetical protein [Polymorphobacter sp. PAMC 29334]QYE33206.1 hypothetical protein KZX46_03610 [Polymorphobacter sp. PAMC 29334]
MRKSKLIESTYLAILSLITAIPVVGVLWWCTEALLFPYGLDYNEGIVWKQMVEIVAGRGYAPIDGFPAIVFHYPPVFHLATFTLAAMGLDPLYSGRIVSLVSTAGSAFFVGDLARRIMPQGPALFSRIATIAGSIMFVLFEAVYRWAPQMRVDAIACFFAIAGLWCVTQCDRRKGLIYVASVCFVLSAFSKQVSVVAAAASFVTLLLLRPQQATRAISTTLLLGALVLAALVWQTHGGIIYHLFLYNINRFEMARILPNLRDGTRLDIPLFLICGSGYLKMAAESWRDRRLKTEPKLTRTAILFFVPIATLSLVTTGKFGSSSSYYIQWIAGLAVCGAFAVASILQSASSQLSLGSPIRAICWALIPLLLALSMVGHPNRWLLKSINARRGEDAELVQILGPVKGDIISDEMVILMRMHRQIVWEPAIFAELARAGRWDERIVIARIRDHRVGAVLSDGDRGSTWFDERYNPAVADAIDEALPRKIRVGSRVVHLPAAAATSTIETPISAAPRR